MSRFVGLGVGTGVFCSLGLAFGLAGVAANGHGQTFNIEISMLTIL